MDIEVEEEDIYYSPLSQHLIHHHLRRGDGGGSGGARSHCHCAGLWTGKTVGS